MGRYLRFIQDIYIIIFFDHKAINDLYLPSVLVPTVQATVRYNRYWVSIAFWIDRENTVFNELSSTYVLSLDCNFIVCAHTGTGWTVGNIGRSIASDELVLSSTKDEPDHSTSIVSCVMYTVRTVSSMKIVDYSSLTDV